MTYEVLYDGADLRPLIGTTVEWLIFALIAAAWLWPLRQRARASQHFSDQSNGFDFQDSETTTHEGESDNQGSRHSFASRLSEEMDAENAKPPGLERRYEPSEYIGLRNVAIVALGGSYILASLSEFNTIESIRRIENRREYSTSEGTVQHYTGTPFAYVEHYLPGFYHAMAHFTLAEVDPIDRFIVSPFCSIADGDRVKIWYIDNNRVSTGSTKQHAVIWLAVYRSLMHPK